MRPLTPLAVALTLVASLIFAAPSAAQDLVEKANGRMADQPDPLQLIRDAASYVQGQDGLSMKLLATMHITAGEIDNKTVQVFDVKLSKPNLYSVALVKPQPEFWVRSNGEQTMTYIAPFNRAAVNDASGGIADFAASQIARSLGNGIGGLAFGLLGTDSAEGIIKETEKSEYMGEETLGEQLVHHCRYASGNMKWDAWFAVGDAPMVVRLQPDLSAIAARAAQAQQMENLKLEMLFDYKDVDTETAIPTEAFALDAPEDAELVDFEDLFAPRRNPPTVCSARRRRCLMRLIRPASRLILAR